MVDWIQEEVVLPFLLNWCHILIAATNVHVAEEIIVHREASSRCRLLLLLLLNLAILSGWFVGRTYRCDGLLLSLVHGLVLHVLVMLELFGLLLAVLGEYIVDLHLRLLF